MKVVDAISPLRGPAVVNESLFEFRGWIRTREVECAVIEQDRKAIVIGNPCVSGELNYLGIVDAGCGQQRARGDARGGEQCGEVPAINVNCCAFVRHCSESSTENNS